MQNKKLLAIKKKKKDGEKLTKAEKALLISRHPKTIPGKIYYGNDGLIKRNGVWVEDTSKYKGGSKQV
tara:strand:- start:38 stop:241 length:204 start_codon:yes stop_codon:yes gene_type:complete